MSDESLFEQALPLSPAERAAFLEQNCSDVEMRLRVEKLLSAHDAAGDFLSPSAPTMEFQEGQLASGSNYSGQPIGPYRLLEKLGEGGMGVVWLAEQTEPVKRRVALKLIKAGLDSSQVLARFAAERQALALMDHPNIAKILDAGVADGSPYFVMELVKGLPITKYCDQEHLTPHERLELFLPVCQAVQHAHQKGIIHRDLKPSNVIVGLYDGKPVPKVIDFGVAKATAQQLSEHTLFTEVGQMIGTLEYMAPEQAELNNLDIDTRADIYSLGVILYELLAGSPPFTRQQLQSAAFSEMLRMIKEVEPPKPSTKLSSSAELPSIAANRHLEPRRLTLMVSGDLDWIVMRCLEKERARRYETANGLALDIQRYLADEAVEAGPPTRLYRIRKFVRRYKGSVTAAGLLLLTLLAGVGGTTWQAVRAADARGVAEDSTARANANFRLALDAFGDMVHSIHNRLKDRADTQDVRTELLRKAQNGLQELLKDAEKAPAGASVLNWAHFRMGDLHLILGDTEAAKREFTIGIERTRALAAADPNSVDVQRDLSVALNKLGDLALRTGKAADALASYEEAQQIRQRQADAAPTDVKSQNELSISMDRLGDVTYQMGKSAKAIEYYEQGLAIRKKIGAIDRQFPSNELDTSVSLSRLGDVQLRTGNAKKALEYYRETLAIRERLARATPQNMDVQRLSYLAVSKLANATMQLGETAAAFELYRKSNDATARLAEADPKNTQVQRDLVVSFNKLGDVARESADREAALKYFHRGLEICQRQTLLDPRNVDFQRDLSMSYDRLAQLTRQIGDAKSAIEFDRKGLEVSERLAKGDPKNALAQMDVFIGRYKLGVGHQALREFDDGRRWLESAQDDLQRFQKEGWVAKPEAMIGTWTVQKWSNDIQSRLAICRKGNQAIDDLQFVLGQPDSEIVALLDVRLRGLAQRNDLANCIATAEALARRNDATSLGQYELARAWCVCAALAQPPQTTELTDRALQALAKAIDGGFKDVGRMKVERDFSGLRSNTEFHSLLAKCENSAKAKK